MPPFITRFAPSPTGYLHLGHAFSALTAIAAARDAGGSCLLRIEDLDEGRSRPAFEAQILEDLAWLGYTPPAPPLRQSSRGGAYATALSRLRAQNLLYRCFRTRKEVLAEISAAPHNPPGADGPVFVGAPLAPSEEAEMLAAGRPFAWRLSVASAVQTLAAPLTFFEEGSGPEGETGAMGVRPDLFGDFIVARKDVGASYHLACVVDDAHQGVTCVIRGEDLFASAHPQRLLQALLGLPAPVYRHHRLICDDAGRRLAKRADSLSLKALREAGVSPQEVRARIGLGA